MKRRLSSVSRRVARLPALPTWALSDGATTDEVFEENWRQFLCAFDDAASTRIDADQQQGLRATTGVVNTVGNDYDTVSISYSRVF